MPNFSCSRLGLETRNMYNHLRGFGKTNLKTTLTKHGCDIEDSLVKLNALDIWHNILHNNSIANELIPEIWMDNYLSIIQACTGLYKYANMSLRSGLETALRLVYFSTHKVEFEWWKNGSKWFTAYGGADVWGRGYEYFTQLEPVKKFEKASGRANKLFAKGGKSLGKLYDNLSGSIHTRAGRFQTSPSRFAPIYEEGKYKTWMDYFLQTQTYTNLLFVLNFEVQSKALNATDKTKILDAVIGNPYRRALDVAMSWP